MLCFYILNTNPKVLKNSYDLYLHESRSEKVKICNFNKLSPFLFVYGRNIIVYTQQKDLAFPFKLSYISALCDLYQACYNKNYEGSAA